MTSANLQTVLVIVAAIALASVAVRMTGLDRAFSAVA